MFFAACPTRQSGSYSYSSLPDLLASLPLGFFWLCHEAIADRKYSYTRFFAWKTSSYMRKSENKQELQAQLLHTCLHANIHTLLLYNTHCINFNKAFYVWQLACYAAPTDTNLLNLVDLNDKFGWIVLGLIPWIRTGFRTLL